MKTDTIAANILFIGQLETEDIKTKHKNRSLKKETNPCPASKVCNVLLSALEKKKKKEEVGLSGLALVV